MFEIIKLLAIVAILTEFSPFTDIRLAPTLRGRKMDIILWSSDEFVVMPADSSISVAGQINKVKSSSFMNGEYDKNYYYVVRH